MEDHRPWKQAESSPSLLHGFASMPGAPAPPVFLQQQSEIVVFKTAGLSIGLLCVPHTHCSNPSRPSTKYKSLLLKPFQLKELYKYSLTSFQTISLFLQQLPAFFTAFHGSHVYQEVFTLVKRGSKNCSKRRFMQCWESKAGC